MGSLPLAGLQARSLWNLLRMGHCAPTIARTIHEAGGGREDWPVRLAAGLPGGIGNTGGECGGITAPLLLLGLRAGTARGRDGLPLVLHQGYELLRRFHGCHPSPFCRQVRGGDRRLLPCVRVIRLAPSLHAAAAAADEGVPAGGPGEACRLLCDRFAAADFHCARAVLEELDGLIPVRRGLLDAAGGFLGGTLLQGWTCSALVAGILAAGLALGRIEGNPLRVLRMVALVRLGGDAFSDRVNRFNPLMNLGGRLARRFAGEFGGTQCRDLTGADFSTSSGARAWLDGGGIGRCRALAGRVAAMVRETLATGSPAPAGPGRD